MASGFLKCCVRRLHSTCRLLTLQKPEPVKNIQPIQMAYSIYDQQRNKPEEPPIIIMHGLFGSKNNWNSLSKAINNLTGRIVITVDARNHGESPHSEDFSYYHLVEDINDLRRQLNVPKACVMGHSMGGRAMMLYALTHPQTVEKLIVVDVSHKNPGVQLTGMKKYFKAMRDVTVSGELTLSAGRKVADDQLSFFIPELEVRQFLLTNLIKEQNNFKWRLNLDVLEKGFDNRITAFPPTSSTYSGPTLFIGGRNSSYLKEEDHEEIKKMFPSAKFEYLNAGHWVHAEKPHELLELVQKFVKEPF